MVCSETKLMSFFMSGRKASRTLEPRTLGTNRRELERIVQPVHPSARAALFQMTGSQADVFRRGSGLHGIRKPLGNRCGLLGYILTEESLNRARERS